MDKFMRILLMFDLPTGTKEERKSAFRFRRFLIKNGFYMMQFSVYVRVTKGIVSAKNCVKNIKKYIPPLGNIRVLIVTEKQFDQMEILLGNISFNEELNLPKTLTTIEENSKKSNKICKKTLFDF